jgi:parvulin-like peptidyl-prolyl isomerase
MPKSVKVLKLPAILIVLIILSGCGKNSSTKEEIVAYVNKEPVYASELQREIARKAKSNPTLEITPETKYDQLALIIDRKLIVQAAMQEGLARKEKFTNTIKNFWEQTLIRDFVDLKNKEAQEYVFAANDEINKYYDNLATKVTFKILKDRNKEVIEKAYKKYLGDKDATNWQTIGPVSYEDLETSEVLDAFSMPKGQVKKFDDGYNYYLIMVSEKEKNDIPPIETLRPDIERKITDLKEKLLFEDWLKKERKNSRIKINKELLK